MQFSTLAVAAFAAFTSAAAINKARAPIDLCPALDTPQCCQVDVDGVLDLTCESPESGLTSVEDFEASCAASGTTAQCCTLPLVCLTFAMNGLD